jgi:hypothetical protein
MSCSISSWQVPQSVPAPQARPTASIDRAPASTASRTWCSERPLQMHKIIG